jgi:hypothetical protein
MTPRGRGADALGGIEPIYIDQDNNADFADLPLIRYDDGTTAVMTAEEMKQRLDPRGVGSTDSVLSRSGRRRSITSATPGRRRGPGRPATDRALVTARVWAARTADPAVSIRSPARRPRADPLALQRIEDGE